MLRKNILALLQGNAGKIVGSSIRNCQQQPVRRSRKRCCNDSTEQHQRFFTTTSKRCLSKPSERQIEEDECDRRYTHFGYETVKEEDKVNKGNLEG